MRRGIRLGGIVALALVGSAVAVYAQAKDPFADRTALATGAYGTIQSRVADIESLRAEAQSKGQSDRVSCIDEKLKRAKANLTASKVVMDGWSLGQSNPEYAQRSIDRLLLMQVYALVYSEEARSCTEQKTTPGESVQIKVDHELPNQPDDDHPDPTRPPRFDRPPLASPF